MRIISEGYDESGLYTVALDGGYILFYASEAEFSREYQKAEDYMDAMGRLELTNLFPKPKKSIN